MEGEKNNRRFRIEVNKERAIDTGMAMILILLLLGYFLKDNIYFVIAIPILIINMTIPKLYYPLAYLWFGFAHIMGTIVSKILLFIVFLIIVVPMAILRRLMGKDSLLLKQWKQSNNSVLKIRNHLYTPSDIDKPY
ncbi:MAG: SxtJ family membrane protein [Bacteroidales bacterium]